MRARVHQIQLATDSKNNTQSIHQDNSEITGIARSIQSIISLSFRLTLSLIMLADQTRVMVLCDWKL
jgi:hypothetical protein